MTKTHGLSKTAIYFRWHNMKQRCANPNHRRYAYYGGRGIKVCERWQKIEGFIEDMGMPPTPRHEIDRINNDGNYEPGNCRWAVRSQQVRNTRKTVLSDELVASLREHARCGGEVRAWARQHGINEQTCYNVTGRGAWRPLEA